MIDVATADSEDAVLRRSAEVPVRRVLPICLSLGLTFSAVAVAEPATFSHQDWVLVLARFVDERGLVDYRGLAAAREPLDRYVAAIARTSPENEPAAFPTRRHELAYYVNAYNALIFHGVLERGPEEDSVWTGGLVSGYAFFVGMKVTVGGHQTNLRQLENKVIRERYADPRIHAALNCASLGCPRLPREVFAPETLDAQLDAAMKEFVGEERNVRPIDSTRTVELSKIFDWFASDFLDYEKGQGNAKPDLIDYVNRYRDAASQIPEDYKIRFLEYDKRLNQQP